MASATFWTEQRPTTRAGVVRVAARDLLLTSAGWAAGAVTIWAIGPKPADPVGAFLLTVGVAIAVPVGLLGLIRRDAPWRDRNRNEGRPSVVWTVMGVGTAQAVTPAIVRYIDEWTAIQQWTAVYPLLLLVILIDAAAKFARPTGWVGIRASEDRRVGTLILVSLVSTFVLALRAADAMISNAPTTCDQTLYYCLEAPRQAWEAALGPLWFGTWSVIIVAMFELRLRFIALTGVSMAYIGYAFWTQDAWRKMSTGAGVVANQGEFVAVQLVGAVALIGAAALIEIYGPRERTQAESRVLRWFGASGTKAAPETPAR